MCVIDYNDEILKLKHVEFYKPPKKGDVFERLQEVRQYIFAVTSSWNPDAVALEDIVLFMGGRSTARTITTLTALNRTVGLAVLDNTGKSPHLYNVMKIRHQIKEGKKAPKKEDVPERVAKILEIDLEAASKGEHNFPYIMNKRNKVAKENEDMADAIAVALCHIFIERAPKKKPRKKRVLKKKE